ncbi:AAA family ATPase [Elizabethkingia anophelis]|nr:AAA family ATPase [Elizabethkingia anophelis]
MNVFFKKLFSLYKLEEIFTPNTVAKLTYVKRDSLDKDIESYIKIPGKQLFVYGHSGSGKTTLLRNKLKELKREFIITHCESDTTYEELVLQAFDQLERFYTVEKSLSKTNSNKGEIKLDYASISALMETKDELKQNRIVPIQLTTQKLASFLGEAKTVWIIEDFHKLEEKEKKKVADVVKIFVDTANDYEHVKIVCIGAVGSARELIELDNNLSNRVAELFVPLLKDSEIKQIVTKGLSFLNIVVEDNLVEKIIYYSNNLASVAHGLCFDICNENDIVSSNFLKKKLNEDSFFRAVNSFVRKNSDTFKKIFDEISSKNFGWYILKTFENSEKENLSIDEIYDGINRNKRPDKNELEEYLNLLSTLEYKEILRYDQSSKKYCISSPLFLTFIKMKMALDKSEQSEIHRKQMNKKNKKYSLKYTDKELIFDEKFFEIFNEQLNKIIINKIEKDRPIRSQSIIKYNNTNTNNRN